MNPKHCICVTGVHSGCPVHGEKRPLWDPDVLPVVVAPAKVDVPPEAAKHYGDGVIDAINAGISGGGCTTDPIVLEQRYIDANLATKRMDKWPVENKTRRWWTEYFRHRYRIIVLRARHDNEITDECDRWQKAADAALK